MGLVQAVRAEADEDPHRHLRKSSDSSCNCDFHCPGIQPSKVCLDSKISFIKVIGIMHFPFIDMAGR